MWALLFNIFPQLISGAITAYNKTVDKQVAEYKVDGTVNVAAISAQVELVQAQRDIIVAEQGHFLTRLPRPVMGLAAAAYITKVLVWDLMLQTYTHGFTPGAQGGTYTLLSIIVGGYFLHDTVSLLKR